jgi:hypothetical protein
MMIIPRTAWGGGTKKPASADAKAGSFSTLALATFIERPQAEFKSALGES